MSDQLYENGQLVDIEGQAFECVASIAADLGNGIVHYTYSFRLKSEVDAQRAAASTEIEANSAEPGSAETAPQELKEETLHVK